MTSQEAMSYKIPAGYWLRNIAAVDAPPNWQLEPLPYESPYLFGHEPAALIAKQYRKVKS